MFKPGDRVELVLPPRMPRTDGVFGFVEWVDTDRKAGARGTITRSNCVARLQWVPDMPCHAVTWDSGWSNARGVWDECCLRKIDDKPELTTWKEIARISGWVPKSLKRLEAIPAG